MLTSRQQHEALVDVPLSKMGVYGLAADRTLKVFELYVRSSVNTASGDITITLPNPGACAGLFYAFEVTVANAKKVTVTDPTSQMTDIVLDADNDRALIYSDGFAFIVIKAGALAAITVLTDSSTGTANDAVAPLVVPTNYDAVTDMTANVTKAEGEAISAALSVLEDEVTTLVGITNDAHADIITKVNSLLNAVFNQS